MLKVGDYVRGTEKFVNLTGYIQPGKIYKVLELQDFNGEQGFRLEESAGGWWTFIPAHFVLAKCPICNSDHSSYAEDEDIDYAKAQELDVSHLPCGDGLGVTYKHKPLPANALTSWPSLHQKMEVAKQLNELKDV